MVVYVGAGVGGGGNDFALRINRCRKGGGVGDGRVNAANPVKVVIRLQWCEMGASQQHFFPVSGPLLPLHRGSPRFVSIAALGMRTFDGDVAVGFFCLGWRW